MSNYTEYFNALDHDRKGFIFINDVTNEMPKYLNCYQMADSEKNFNKLIEFIKVSHDGKVYMDNFVDAMVEFERFTNNQMSNVDDMGDRERCNNSDFSPFINDSEIFSTEDSGFGNHDLNESLNRGIGKRNKKLIKRLQLTEILQNKDSDPYNMLQKKSSENDQRNPNDLSGYLHIDDINSGFTGKRRQSDFVTCASRKAVNRNKYNVDDDSHSLNCWTPCSGSVADLFLHDSMTDIQNTLEKLERSMDNLQSISAESKHSKRKHVDENSFLIEQMHSLEEKSRELQKQFEKDLYLEREAARKNLGRLEKSKFEEIEYLKMSLKSKQSELESLRKDLNAAITENERLRYEKLRSEDKMIDLQQQMTSIEGEMMRVKDFHCRELDLIKKERNLLFAKVKGMDTINVKNVIPNNEDIRDDISRLRSENSELKRKLEECENEFLALTVQQGHSILQYTTLDNSWMAEVDGYTKDEIINLLVKEKDANFRLREYVTGILTRIIDKDPSLLEIS